MRVVHLSTSDIKGGAARSAYRVHCGLVERGHDSLMLVRQKSSDDPRVIAAPLDDESARTLQLVQERCIDNNRTPLSNTHFSIGYPHVDLSARPEIQSADIIHLHWVSGFQSPQSIRALGSLGKPIVWTFHDQRAFTGGCHFSAGCTRYEAECGDCPQLQEDFFQLSRAAVTDERDLLPTRAMTVVCPSAWMANCARASATFRDCKIDIVPYGIDTTVFYSRNKADARASLGLPEKSVVLLFGGDGLMVKRKGFPLLVEAMQLAMQQRKFAGKVRQGEIVLACFGGVLGPLRWKLPTEPLQFGRIETDEVLAAIYSAADLFLLPSLEDNLPNVMIESICCGTPGVGFKIGGVPDVMTQGLTGRLVRPNDAAAFAKAIVDLSLSPTRRAWLRWNCGKRSRRRWSNKRQVASYLQIYERARKRAPSPVAGAGASRFEEIFPQLVSLANERSVAPDVPAPASE